MGLSVPGNAVWCSGQPAMPLVVAPLAPLGRIESVTNTGRVRMGRGVGVYAWGARVGGMRASGVHTSACSRAVDNFLQGGFHIKFCTSCG